MSNGTGLECVSEMLLCSWLVLFLFYCYGGGLGFSLIAFEV